MHTPMVEFWECVQVMPLNAADLGKLASRTIDGIYLGGQYGNLGIIGWER